MFIMGDDIGWMQPSIYHRGLMVGETPNIDRIGNEGAMFTDYYAEQSCTAGRTAFFTGMNPLRVGMLLPEIPGSPSYLQPGTLRMLLFSLMVGKFAGDRKPTLSLPAVTKTSGKPNTLIDKHQHPPSMHRS